MDEIYLDAFDLIQDDIAPEMIDIYMNDKLAYEADLRFYELMWKKEKTARTRRELLAMKILPVVMSQPCVAEYNRPNANSN